MHGNMEVVGREAGNTHVWRTLERSGVGKLTVRVKDVIRLWTSSVVNLFLDIIGTIEEFEESS